FSLFCSPVPATPGIYTLSLHDALPISALWLLHPLWASTVLYVVQRHAMLAAFFVMAGIRAWIASRNAFDQGRSTRGWLLAVLAVDRKSTRLNSSHVKISYAVFCLKKKK